MSEPATPTITIDMDAKCAECKAPGRSENGLCLGCTGKAMRGEPMNTPTGQEVRHRLHNQKTGDTSTVAKSGFAKDQLRSFIDRIERLEEERAALSADIKEVYSEAKGTGFDTAIMRQVIRMRKLDKADFQEQEAMLDLYLTAMDMR